MTRRFNGAVTIRLSNSHEHYLSVLSGQRRGAGSSLARLALRIPAAIYSAIIRLRNRCYDANLGVKRLPRPVISVGNLTTGGTGKTPVVCWLCRHLQHLGHRPAVLMRGYKAKPGQLSDEQAMLRSLLGRGAGPPAIVYADPDRVRGGTAVLAGDEGVTLFVLDDGFQHRRLARDFDLVLIDAINPFGFEHILPRGLLREPVSGLSRAHAVLITHAGQIPREQLDRLSARLQRLNPEAPVYRCSHRHVGFRTREDLLHPLSELEGRRTFVFAGIGGPEALERQLGSLPGKIAGMRWFPDHHHYTAADIHELLGSAKDAGADLLLTTEKDWTKLASQWADESLPPMARLELAIEFEAEDESALLSQILTTLSVG